MVKGGSSHSRERDHAAQAADHDVDGGRETCQPEILASKEQSDVDRNAETGGEETEEARIERLGRQRPEKFKSIWEELGFCYSVIMSQILSEYFVSGFAVIIPPITKDLDIAPASRTWPANAFSLVVASFLLTFGRLADVWGGYPVYVAGFGWLTIWSLIAGFSQNELMLDFCRALQGLGPAAYLPSSLMLLGSVYRPGPRKNIVFSVYSAAAALGFYIGIFFAGVCGQYTTWSWYFWIGAILAASTTIVAFLTIPSDVQERKHLNVKMDWWGSLLISVGLILVVFAITDSAHAPDGWGTPYIYVTLIVGAVVLGVAVWVEGWVAENPLLPFDIFEVKYMKPLLVALFFSYGALGIFLLYTTFYMTDIMGGTPLQLVAWFTPMALLGCILATAGGFILHLIPGTGLVILSGVASIISPLLFALMPQGGNYFAWVFPSMICATIGIDISFGVTNIFITTQMPLRRQGLAGALINSILHLGIAFFLGFADVTAQETSNLGKKDSYKAVFWYEVACAGISLAILVLFVKIRRAKSDLTADERAEVEQRGGEGE